MKKQLHSIKLLKFLSFSCLLLLGINMGWGQNVQSLSATTSTTWLCPAGVTSVQVETWSGGGGGGGASSNTKIYVGGGGAGGNYAKQTAVTVIPGHTYNVNIGAGGIAGASTSALGYGGIGGTTSFVDQTGTLTLLSVSGGTGGQLGTAAYTSGWGGTNAGGNLSAIVITAGAYTAAPTIVIGKQWVSGATYVLNEQVFSGANLYTVTSISSGAGAGTIAPTGTSTSVNNGNGTAVLTYAGVAATASTNATFGYVKFVNVGSGYTTAPTVTISGGTFTLQGAATAYINPFVTTNVNGTGTFTTYKGGSGTAGYYVASTAGNSSGTGGGGAGSSGNGGNGTLPSAASTSYSGGTGGTGAGNGASNSIATAAGGTFNGVAGGVAGGGSGAAYSGTGGAGGAGKVVITILDLTPPANPGTLTVPNIAANSLGLSWVASADAANADFTGYLVVRYTSAPAADNDPVQNVAYTTGSTFSTGASPMTGTVVSIGTATNASDTGLTTGTKYYYKVYAFDSNRNYSGESSASETPANVVDITPPGNPGVATITNQTTSSLTVNWVAASNGTEGGGYLVVRYTGTPEADSNPVTGVVYDLVTVKTIATGTPPVTDPVTTAKNGTVVYTGNNLTLNQSGLLAEKNYYYRVFTFDAAYNYSAASIVTGKTSVQLTAPVANAGSNTSGTGFTTNWDAVAESATGYSPTGYTATVYNLGAESTLVGWTIPATVAEASTLTADITTTNTTTSQLTQSNGTINTGSSGSTAAGSGTGSSGFSARGASYYPISTSVFATATIETVAGSGPYTAIISAMSSTSGLSAGQPLTATAGTGDLGLGTMTIVSIIDATSINVTSTDTFTAGTVTALTVTKTKATPDKYWQVDANTTGYKNIKISSQQYSAADGTRDFKVQYSSTGASGTFTDLTTVTLVASTWNTQVSGIALPAECDNNANVVLRWLQTSFTRVDGTEMTTTSGTSRIDNVLVKGQLLTSVATASAVGPAATSVAVTGLTTGGIYYYDVVATGTNTTNSGGLLTSYATSAKSNLISYTFLIPEGYANFRSKGTASTSSASNWEFNDGVSWFNATVAPTSTNNITVSAANEVTVGADFSVSLGKSITVASTGTINLAGHVVSGAGSFVLSSGASLKLGNNASIATAITTTTTLNTAANYFYDGTVAQNTTALPGLSSTTVTMTGNVTVSNAAGVTLANNLKIQTPGTLEVTATGKLLWGDGNVTSATIGSGTFTTSGSGYFIARTGSTLVITSSKGIGYMDALSPTSTIGSIKNTAASGRTFEPNVNYIFAKNDAANAINMGTAFVSGTDTNIALNISATAGINNLTISNPLGVYLPGAVQAVNAGGVTVTDYVPDTDITVNGVLNLVSGQLIANNGANLTTTVGVINVYSTVPQTTGTKTVTIANSGSITGAGSGTGWVIGNLKKATVSGDRPSFTYTIGDATNYTPLALTFIGNTTATGGLTARVNTGDHASVAGSGIDATKSVNRTWTLTNDALAGFGSYNAAFAYANADNDAGTTPANYLAHLYSGSAWSILTPSGTATTTAATATGITGFGDFAIGECASLTTTGSVTTSICAGDSYHWDANNTDYTTAQTGVTVVSGCNTATLNLSITPLTTTGSVTTSICAGGTYHWDANNTDYTTAQTGLTHTVGCNTATLNLTVNPLTTTGSVTLSQNGGSYTWATVNGGNGLTYTASATATVVTGCNTATLNLTISATVIPTSPLNLCKGATVASVTGTTSLKFYKDNVTTTQLVSTTKFVTAVTY
ncbi:beta strand repeat-containing protein, partial [Flavobacterium sp.]|uniref:beta strand repeat-containing protein n=1 Tax=Flavobacterium sp. TaxID=239 RepID=UPI0038FCE287